jgi:hypothetical protein
MHLLAGGKMTVNVPTPPGGPQVAGTAFNAFSETYYLTLLPNGTLIGALYQDSKLTQFPNIKFSKDPPAKFSSIAMTNDARMYGITNDTILEYSIDRSDLSTLRYEGQVYPF